jgi:hypothetical protein
LNEIARGFVSIGDVVGWSASGVVEQQFSRMSNKLVLVWIFSGCCLGCGAQTNQLGLAGIDFCRASIQLRPVPGKALPKIAPTAPAEPTAAMELGMAGVSGAGLERSQVVRPGQFYLSGPQPGEPEPSRTTVFLDSLFTAEKVQIGRTSLACPFWTAIKRRNPLAILSWFSTGSGDGLLEFKLLDLSW